MRILVLVGLVVSLVFGGCGEVEREGDAGKDLGVDVQQVDLNQASDAVPDSPSIDTVIADSLKPDMAQADQAIPDQAVVDQAIPDKAMPDQAVVDQAIPDKAMPDQAIVDQTIPDKALPDLPPVDAVPPDTFPCTGGCYIDSVCQTTSKVNPHNACQKCDPTQSALKWTSIPSCVATVAGVCGTNGYLDGTALSAKFQYLGGIALDSQGKLYIADHYNHRIRVLHKGQVSTLAGTGTKGFDNGAALTKATFNLPRGVAVDSAGNVYVAEEGNHAIRKISGGLVSTVAGTGTSGKVNGTASSAKFNMPMGIALDKAANIYVGDSHNNEIRKISAGTVSTVISGLAWPWGIDFDSAGTLHATELTGQVLISVSSGKKTVLAGTTPKGYKDGAALSAKFSNLYDLAIAQDGVIYLADHENHVIRAMAGNQVSTIAGTPSSSGFLDGAPDKTKFSGPVAVALDADGNLYVADNSNHCVRFISRPYKWVENFDAWNSTVWAGAKHEKNIHTGSWAPSLSGGKAIFTSTDTSWRQIGASVPTIKQGDTVEVTITPSLASGGSEYDAALIQLCDGWVYYGGNCIGAIFSKGKLQIGGIKKTFNAFGTYTKGKQEKITLTWKKGNVIRVSNGTLSKEMTDSVLASKSLKLYLACKDSTDGFTVDKVVFY